MRLSEFIKVGTRIKLLRKNAGLTQREMATRLGLSYSTYSNYENNLREPGLDVITKIAKELNVTIADILGLSKESIDDLEKSLSLSPEELEKTNTEKRKKNEEKEKEEIIKCVFMLAKANGNSEYLLKKNCEPDYDLCLALFYNLADQLKIFIDLLKNK